MNNQRELEMKWLISHEKNTAALRGHQSPKINKNELSSKLVEHEKQLSTNTTSFE